jgi:dihydrofolate reductase
MELTIIVSASDNNIIGNQGKIPWHIPEDLRRFKRLTENHPVIMGEKTFLSIFDRNSKPLPNRKNIVLSEERLYHSGIFVAHSIREAIALCDNQDAYVIGGARVYQEFLRLTNKIELTRVHQHFEGDTFFPEIKPELWSLVNQEDGTSTTGIPYSFLTYNRK